MADLDYQLTYAGVPFVGDVARVYRMSAKRGASDPNNTWPKTHQPVEGLYDELNRRMPFRQMRDLGPATNPLPHLATLKDPAPPQDLSVEGVQIGEYVYPVGAARYSIFRGLATSRMAAAMLAATAGGLTPAAFVMQNQPAGAVGNATGFTVTTNLYLLPPRPLGEPNVADGLDGLYLITLVDERYRFTGTPLTLRPDSTTTWDQLIQTAAATLGIALTYSTLDPAYGQPEPDSALWASLSDASLLLDALAANVGRTVVRNLDGTYQLQTAAEARAIVLANQGAFASVQRAVGGEIFASGAALPAGDLRAGRNAITPAQIVVAFPKYIYGADPIPHFLNPRASGRTAWCEEDFGDEYGVVITPSSGGALVSGVTGIGSITLLSTAKSLYASEAAAVSGAMPDNNSGCVALAMRLAGDRYDALAPPALDVTYPGVFAWTPEGLNTVIWTYAERYRECRTRIVRPEWNVFWTMSQHAAPAMSGSSVVSGGMGRTVAQTWRDQSGTSIPQVNLVTVGSGAWLASGARTSGGLNEAVLVVAGGGGGGSLSSGTVSFVQSEFFITLGSGTYNNYDLPDCNIFFINLTGPILFTGWRRSGIAGQSGLPPGRVIEVYNATKPPTSGSNPNTITLLVNDSRSSGPYQFNTPDYSPIIIQPYETVCMKYHGSGWFPAERLVLPPYTNTSPGGGGGTPGGSSGGGGGGGGGSSGASGIQGWFGAKQISSGTVGLYDFGSGAVVSGQVGTAALNSGYYASGSIGWPHLSSGTVRSGHVGDAAVVSGSIASGQIGQYHLSSGTVNSGQVGNAAVVSGSIASGQIVWTHLTSGCVHSGHINDNAVVSGSVGSGQLAAVHISSGTILGQSGIIVTPSAANIIIGMTLGSGAIQSGMIASGAINSGNYASGSIGWPSYGSGSIQSGALASGVVPIFGVIGLYPQWVRYKVLWSDWSGGKFSLSGVLVLTGNIPGLTLLATKTFVCSGFSGAGNNTPITPQFSIGYVSGIGLVGAEVRNLTAFQTLIGPNPDQTPNFGAAANFPSDQNISGGMGIALRANASGLVSGGMMYVWLLLSQAYYQ